MFRKSEEKKKLSDSDDQYPFSKNHHKKTIVLANVQQNFKDFIYKYLK